MRSITTTVWTHRHVVGALAALVLAAVALLLFKTGQVRDMHHHLVTGYHHLPRFVRIVLGAGRLGS